MYFHWGGSDRDDTNISQICAEFVVCIFFYDSILTKLFQVLAWSNWILDRYLCSWFKIISLIYFCYFLCTLTRSSGKQSYLFSTPPVANNLFAWHWDFIVLSLHLSKYVDLGLISVPDYMLSTPDDLLHLIVSTFLRVLNLRAPQNGHVIISTIFLNNFIF